MDLSNRSLSAALLVTMFCMTPIAANASEISYGAGISVDGQIQDWNLITDNYAPMYMGGDAGESQLADLYMRYDCDAHILYTMVLDNSNDMLDPVADSDGSWFKIFEQGLPDDLLMDSNGRGNFAWIYDMNGGAGDVIGYEASAPYTFDGVQSIEAALHYGVTFASTGGALFDVDAFNTEVDAMGQAGTRVRVQYPHNGGPALFPDTEIDLDGDGVSEISTTSWCIDTDRTINDNTWYCADLISSYNYPDGLDDTRWENLDAVNWILNQDFVGQEVAPFGVYTYGDVQVAIWNLLEDAISPNGLGPWDEVRVGLIVGAAAASVVLEDPAIGYVPPCDGVVGMLLFPENCDNGNSAQYLIAQMLVSEFPVVCTQNSIEMDVQCTVVVEADALPVSHTLSPAFPNPFNPSTMLTVSLAETGLVELKVYDLNGALVATLMNGLVSAGSHEVHFQASELPSGIYFAVLQTENFTSTQKMTLIK